MFRIIMMVASLFHGLLKEPLRFGLLIKGSTTMPLTYDITLSLAKINHNRLLTKASTTTPALPTTATKGQSCQSSPQEPFGRLVEPRRWTWFEFFVKHVLLFRNYGIWDNKSDASIDFTAKANICIIIVMKIYNPSSSISILQAMNITIAGHLADHRQPRRWLSIPTLPSWWGSCTYSALFVSFFILYWEDEHWEPIQRRWSSWSQYRDDLDG